MRARRRPSTWRWTMTNTNRLVAFLASLSLLNSQGWATPARVTGWFQESSGSLPVSITTGDALCVFARSSGSGTMSVSDNGPGGGNTYTSVPDASVSFGGGSLAAFYLLNTESATSIAPSVTTGSITGIWVDEYSRVATSGALDGTGGNQLSDGAGAGTNSVSTTTWATSVNGDLICAAYLKLFTTGTPNPGSAFALGNDDESNYNVTEYQIQSTASSSTAGVFSTTGAASNGLVGAFALEAAGSPPASSCSVRNLRGVGC
jgi:hypothetical protein